jgi:hypothetical protein
MFHFNLPDACSGFPKSATRFALMCLKKRASLRERPCITCRGCTNAHSFAFGIDKRNRTSYPFDWTLVEVISAHNC